MKKMLKFLIVVCSFATATCLMADFLPNAAPNISTVAQANKSDDGTFVTLTGKITDEIGRGKYLFTDSTGQTSVVISRRDWRGVDVTPQTTVTISGKVKKNFWNFIGISSNPEIEVSRITVPDGQNVTGYEEKKHRPLRNAIESMESDM